MRYKLILVFLSSLVYSQKLISVSYIVKRNDISQTFILDINNDNSLFYSDEYCDSSSDNIDNYIAIEKLNNSTIIHDQVELLAVKTFFKDELKWDLKNNITVKNNVKLFEASTNYHNRKWIVYYNPDIPINKGPFIFSGLPGLVYEIKSNDLSIEIISINYEKNKDCYVIEKDESFIDLKDYKKYNSNFLNTFQESIDENLGIKSEDLADILLKSVKKDLFREFL